MRAVDPREAFEDGRLVAITMVRAALDQALFAVTFANLLAQACYARTSSAWFENAPSWGVCAQKGPAPLDDLAGDKTASIDVQLGTIKFIKEGAGTSGLVCLDTTFADSGSGTETRIAMDVTFPADPAHDPVLDVVERAKSAIVERLRSAAAILEAKSALSLLVGEDD